MGNEYCFLFQFWIQDSPAISKFGMEPITHLLDKISAIFLRMHMKKIFYIENVIRNKTHLREQP